MTAITAPAARPIMGFVAPRPESFISTNITPRQKIEIRPGEPVYMFIPTRMGAGTSLEGLNKNTPFAIKRMNGTPAGVTGVRTMGQWYQISLKPGEKAGQKDQLKLVTRPVVADPNAAPTSITRFTAVSGNQRFY